MSKSPVVAKLAAILAESYTLYLQTQNFHWHVEGPDFQPLHSMFEEQYSELAEAIDEVAERIRALGAVAPGSFAEFGQLSGFEIKTGVTSGPEMVAILLGHHRELIKTLRAGQQAAEQAGDQVSLDLLIKREAVHSKTAWMLAALLGKVEELG